MSTDKEIARATDEHVAPVEYDNGTFDAPALPSGWKYRQRRIFGWNIPWYASPKVQLFMVAFVCFMCPGMFNALGGLGGGGKTDATLADNMVKTPLNRQPRLARELTVDRTPLCIVHSQSSVSSVEPSSTSSV
jgi:hypothetical protein